MTRSILITGCSSGIGYHCAHALHARGWNVLATCRKPEDAERLRAEGLTCGVLDLSDTDSITAGLSWALDQTGGTLDALFNNGAFGLPGAVEDLPTDGLREIFETNFFGWHELTRQVIPVMRAQGHGRIVQNSSVLGFITYKWRAAYVSTKFALEGLTDTMRLELNGSGIHVVLIEPGPVTSKIRENARSHFERWIDWENSALSDLYRDTLLKRLYEDKDKPDAFELPPDAVAKKLIHALEAGRPRPRYYVTVPTYFMGAMKRLLPTRALDWLIDKG
ncbi:SDR family oxidoreductase [Nioella sediminis]|jgi:NAD(P)-dependent dehydrogenase (short-subunit alcohol dehydrogenase family)|uniref:SDR family oxidoreductase n=1 Tax=Nioella sediminis TaxID=1912092 RepID=UPI0008FD3979|nr:SDR family oxidoreductase [Nioella sediminis]TBX15482.1 oxidoreductase [Roseovarius sp. JS7-11]